MSIVAYVGKPGSGKSYGVVENVILPSLEDGRTIVTNIPLKVGYLNDDYPKGKIIRFEPKDPIDNPDFWNHDEHAGAIWVIDECWRYWKAGTQARNIPEEQQAFFTEHRHNVGEDGKTTEIVLVTQALSQVAAFVRELVEETYRAEKLTALGTSKRFRIDVFNYSEKSLDGGKPSRQLMGTYKDSVYKYYHSHSKNKTDFAAGMEEKADKRNVIWKSPIFKFGLPVALIIIYFSVSSMASYFTRYTETEQQPQTEQTDNHQAPIAQPKQNTQHNTPHVPRRERQHLMTKTKMVSNDASREYLPLSDTYRIVGLINDIFLIWTKQGTFQIPKKACDLFHITKEDYCVYNGELVTWYSSEIPETQYSRNYFEGDLLDDAF